MNISSTIRHEILAFESRKGSKPKSIIFVDKELSDAFFKELSEFTIRTDVVEFNMPGQFMGVSFFWKDIWIYGGQCKWLLVGEQ